MSLLVALTDMPWGRDLRARVSRHVGLPQPFRDWVQAHVLVARVCGVAACRDVHVAAMAKDVSTQRTATALGGCANLVLHGFAFD